MHRCNCRRGTIRNILELELFVRIRNLLLPLITIIPLSAQSWEVGLFAGQQTYRSEVVSPESGPVPATIMDSGSKVVIGVRLGKSVVDFGPVLLQLTLGYQPEATNTIQTSPTYSDPYYSSNYGPVDYKASHASVGAMMNFKAFVAFGAGIEYRFEKLNLDGSEANYNRPWARANVGFAIPSPVLKPFFGLEVDFPLSSTSSSGSSSRVDLVRSLAPKGQIGINAGIRF